MAYTAFQLVIIGDLLITCVTGGPLANEDFDAWVAAMRSQQVKRYLAIVDGSLELNSLQRKIGSEAGKKLRAATVTDDRFVRGIVTAVSWLGVDIKAFPHSELSAAIKHLGVQEIETQVMMAIKRLREGCRKIQLAAKRPVPLK